MAGRSSWSGQDVEELLKTKKLELLSNDQREIEEFDIYQSYLNVINPQFPTASVKWLGSVRKSNFPTLRLLY